MEHPVKLAIAAVRIAGALLFIALATGCSSSPSQFTTSAARSEAMTAGTPSAGNRAGGFLDTHWVDTRNAFSATGLATRPHHIALSVRDLDASMRWYESKLGAREVVRFNVGTDIRGAMLSLGGSDFYFELFELTGSVPEPAPSSPATALKKQGFTHFGFLVGDVSAAYKALSARGVEFVVPPTEYQKGLPVAFFRDLDGNLFELSPAHPNPAP